ncbi:DUF58 domain-containing protein [Halogeometricum borinquense]|uniref:DUF58 domain-containing protein n=1 Tax=Halogeometricum borinquense TaxID=60847 RepID=A0A6C0UKS6_9EURY|nr:DUF58 domain-containing protein [Halogeometricum borinquense]QIB75183.1 DUF58 domain-containing protein [Halogeometricum borinquense]QIQ75838.1 DUF58 domain-containing protein [Halogeometricum borinquense]
MSDTRRPILNLGIVSSLVGLLLIVFPTLGSVVELTGTARAIPFVIIGFAAIGLAGWYLRAEMTRQSATRKCHTGRSEYPRPANRPQYAYPGEPLVRRFAEISWTDRREEEPTNRLDLRADVRELAVTVLSQTERWTRTEIETRLDEGGWTDDARAAAFFTDDTVPSLSVRQQLQSILGAEPPFARRARHAIAELASQYDETDVSPNLTERPNGRDRGRTVTTRQYWPSHTSETSRTTKSGRTRWVTTAALVAGGAGIVTLQPALFLLALFGIALAGYGHLSTPPSGNVEITRTISDPNPEPQQEIDVTVTIQNTSESTLTDLRVIDGVPAGLTVTDGVPRFTTALRPGNEATFTYTVRVVAGSHAFDPALVITRDAIGIHKRETLVEGDSTAISSQRLENPERQLQLRSQRTNHPGRIQSTVEGPGIEFHSIREYRSGDPLSRVDWNRKAKTGELTTIDFRESRLAKVMIVVDTRPEAYLTPTEECDRPIIRRSLTAARKITTHLSSERIPVGITALSPHSCWLPPKAGDVHRVRIHNALDEDSAFSWERPEDGVEISTAIEAFRQRACHDTQVILLSPLCDDGSKRVAERLDANGYAVTVLSPDPTALTDSTPDCALGYASVMRHFRLRKLRNGGIPVYDLTSDLSVAEVLARAS